MTYYLFRPHPKWSSEISLMQLPKHEVPFHIVKQKQIIYYEIPKSTLHLYEIGKIELETRPGPPSILTTVISLRCWKQYSSDSSGSYCYPICGLPTRILWVACDSCDRWFHAESTNIDPDNSCNLHNVDWVCNDCVYSLQTIHVALILMSFSFSCVMGATLDLTMHLTFFQNCTSILMSLHARMRISVLCWYY